jgi:NAD-dependent deacetylase
LTGAGISAESGIPTFRDAQSGLWARYRPEDLATPEAFERDPKLVWEWYAWRRERVKNVAPNPGHLALVELERRTGDFTLITQNVDNLHQRAGSRRIIELHGNITRVKCFERGHAVSEWGAGTPPRCPQCDGRLRPDVVWFGENLPDGVFEQALAAAEACDVFLSIGTSALVYPAASLPMAALERGGWWWRLIPNRPALAGMRSIPFGSLPGSACPGWWLRWGLRSGLSALRVSSGRSGAKRTKIFPKTCCTRLCSRYIRRSVSLRWAGQAH